MARPAISAENEQNSARSPPSIIYQQVWEHALVCHISGPLHTHSFVFLLQLLETHTSMPPLSCTSLVLLSPALGSLLSNSQLLIPRWGENSILRIQSGHSRASQHFLLLMIYPFISTPTQRQREWGSLTALSSCDSVASIQVCLCELRWIDFKWLRGNRKLWKHFLSTTANVLHLCVTNGDRNAFVV